MSNIIQAVSMSNIIQAVSWIPAIVAIVHQVKASKQFSSGETVKAYISEIVAVMGWTVAYLVLTFSKMAM